MSLSFVSMYRLDVFLVAAYRALELCCWRSFHSANDLLIIIDIYLTTVVASRMFFDDYWLRECST